MIDFYIILFDAVAKNPEKIGHGRDGYYFGIGKDSEAEYSMYEASAAIGKALVDLGVHQESEPTPFSEEEYVTYFGSKVSTPSSMAPSVTPHNFSRISLRSSAQTRAVWLTTRSPSDGNQPRARRTCWRASKMN